MAGVTGLGKGDRQTAEKRAEDAINPQEQEAAAEDFINGARERLKAPVRKVRAKVYERHTFSLTKAVSDDIDSISYLPEDFRVNRSDVVKAAIDLLKGQPEEEVIKQLIKVK